MGKGDKRTRRGKIYRGSFGKSRPKAGPKPVVAAKKAPVKAPVKAPAKTATRAGAARTK